MKTKLLKKVRKRYTITRYDKLSSSAPWILLYFKDVYGLPFFGFEDKHNEYKFRYRKTYNECLDVLIENIRKEYKHTKKIEIIKEKVWYKK